MLEETTTEVTVEFGGHVGIEWKQFCFFQVVSGAKSKYFACSEPRSNPAHTRPSLKACLNSALTRCCSARARTISSRSSVVQLPGIVIAPSGFPAPDQTEPVANAFTRAESRFQLANSR